MEIIKGKDSNANTCVILVMDIIDISCLRGLIVEGMAGHRQWASRFQTDPCPNCIHITDAIQKIYDKLQEGGG